MEHYKISKALNNSIASKFVTWKWIKVHDLSCSQYSVNKNIRFEKILGLKCSCKSDFSNYNDGCLGEKETIDDEHG